MDKQREVVITGMGVTSPLGHTPEIFFANLLEGRSGISNITRFDTSAYAVHFAGEIKEFDGSPYFDAKEIGRTSRFIQYMVHAADSAVANSGLSAANLDITRAGMIGWSKRRYVSRTSTNAHQVASRTSVGRV
ncbi:MAG: beta-ketoacyl synthase N-terminal-like domain-containing protein, partial [Fibrobacteria bacterium]